MNIILQNDTHKTHTHTIPKQNTAQSYWNKFKIPEKKIQIHTHTHIEIQPKSQIQNHIHRDYRQKKWNRREKKPKNKTN